MELLFYKAGGDWLDSGVRWWTWGPHSHAELRFEEYLTFSASWRDGGVRWRDMPVRTDRWDRLRIDIPQRSANKLMRWAAARQGRYDLWGVFGHAIGSGIQDTTKWYCSEICAAGLNQVLPDELPEHVSPSKLYNLCVQRPDIFRPLKPDAPFERLLTREHLPEAREAVRDFQSLPTNLLPVAEQRLLQSDPVLYAVVQSLMKQAPSGW